MSTVSNVLNNPAVVAPPTRLRVEAAMDRVGYVRNGAARQLRGAPSTVVGCVLLDTANAYYAAVARGAEDRLAEAGCVLVRCSSDVDAGREERFLRMLEEQGVRGILVSPAGERLERFERLARRGVPVVLLDLPRGRSELCAVTVDNVTGGELAARHLRELGHRRIAFVRTEPAIRTIRDRSAGIRRALAGHGTGAGGAPGFIEVPVASGPLAAVAREATDALLALSPRPTGVLCVNDMTALAVLRGLRRAGVRVPAEMSVVGYDDLDFTSELSPALTTVRQPAYRLGHAAADLLLTEGAPGHTHRECVFLPELVVRDSTAPHRA